MGVILKHTFRNIFAKPLITIFLILSITVCSFTGMMAFDMSNSLDNVIRGVYASVFGKSNVVFTSELGIDKESFADRGRYDAALIADKTSKMFVRNDQMYAYYNEKALLTRGVDIDDAKQLGLLPKNIELADDECILTDVIAKENNLKEGDSFTIFGDNFVNVEYTIKKIIPVSGLLSSNYTALVTEDGLAKLNFDGKTVFDTAYIRLHDETQLDDFCSSLEQLDTTATVENLVSGKMMQQQINTITGIFIGLFIITLLLVIFVTITLSERIMIERLSTVGTLRSLGVSPTLTSRVILVENFFYGFFGGIIGTILYALTRDTIFNKVFTVSSGTDIQTTIELGQISYGVMAAVIIGSIIVEMLCPLRELFKATSTPIRNLIFDSRDTDYKYKKKYFYISLAAGCLAIICLVLGLFVLENAAVVCLLSFVLLVVAGFTGYPFLLRRISTAVEKVSDKAGCPILSLAALNLKTKKTSIGCSKLTFIATSISICLFVVISSFNYLTTSEPADADVVVRRINESADSFSYIETLDGVTDMEFLYKKLEDRVIVGTENINGFLADRYIAPKKDSGVLANIYGTDGNFRLIRSIKGLPETLGDDAVYVSKNFAGEIGIKEGDTVELLLNADGVTPCRRKFKVAGYVNTSQDDVSGKSFVISLENYKRIYFDTPHTAYVKTSDPERVRELINSYSSSMVGSVQTMDEYIAEVKQTSAGMLALLYLIIIMGVGLALIGVFCNQIVGFENRKRESAVLVSTAFSREKLVKLFACENLISSITAIVFGVAAGAVETGLCMKMMSIMIEIPIKVDVLKTVLFLLIIFITFSITIFKTIRNINRMKISEQLKYE